MKKLFLSMMLLVLPLLVSAYDCQVDGIYYNLNSEEKTAEVTYESKDLYDNVTSVYTGSVDIPERFTYDGVEYTVTSIGKAAFVGCNGLTSVTIPNTVTNVADFAFRGCDSLPIENGVRYAGTYLIEVVDKTQSSYPIKDGTRFIADGAFNYCRNLTSVEIPNSVITIGERAFCDCRYLTSVAIGNSVGVIEKDAFQNCISLNAVYISDLEAWCNINFIISDGYYPGSSTICTANPLFYAHHLFLNEEEIKDLIIPNSITEIGFGAFQNCNSLTTITIPNSVTAIRDFAFAGCSALTSLTIGNSVTNIGYCSFRDCSGLTSVTIPKSINSIGDDAFCGCNITDVYCYAENTPFVGFLSAGGFPFSDISQATLYVPIVSLNAYRTDWKWGHFGTIKAIDADLPKCATPTISYADKELKFSCETEGVEYHCTITDSDIKSTVASNIPLSATYEISVYATKEGFYNSDVATATLVWTDAIFTETTPETPTSAKAVQESIPVLISAKGGNISVKCEADGQEVNVYTIDGLSLGAATVKNGEALISTSIPSGDIAVVKVGGRSVKVIMR